MSSGTRSSRGLRLIDSPSVVLMAVEVLVLGEWLRNAAYLTSRYLRPPCCRPICVKSHLAPFLPGHPLIKCGGDKAIEAVAAAPWGSASIATISWAYIKMLGGSGLTDTAKISLLNANYIAKRLEGAYTLKFSNKNGKVAHECLIDLAEFDKMAGLKVMDFAKRLQDYSFHREPCYSLPLEACPDSVVSQRPLCHGPSPLVC